MRTVGDPVSDLQKEGGFSDPGVSADQNNRARDNAAAQDPVKLPYPGQKPFTLGLIYLIEGDRR